MADDIVPVKNKNDSFNFKLEPTTPFFFGNSNLELNIDSTNNKKEDKFTQAPTKTNENNQNNQNNDNNQNNENNQNIKIHNINELHDIHELNEKEDIVKKQNSDEKICDSGYNLSNSGFTDFISKNEEKEKQKIINIIKYRLTQKNNMLEQITDSILVAKKDKAVLSLKYDTLTFKINCVQLLIIFLSTLITFIETLKLQYELDDKISIIIPIIFSTIIGLISAMQRFLRWDDKKENILTILERFSFIINKCRKIKHYIINFNINDEKNQEKWNDLVSNYENETYDYMITTRESFDNAMTYKELINYRKRLKNLYIEEKFLKQDIDNIDSSKKTNVRKFQNNGCCGNTKFNKYLDEIEEEIDNEMNNKNLKLNRNITKTSLCA